VFEDLDELARGLAENEVSRSQAMKWAGYSVLGAALSSIGFADTAEALTRRQKRRCLRRGGMVCGERPRANQYCCQEGTTCAGGNTCAESNCTGGSVCQNFPFGCQNSTTCFCTQTVEGVTGTCVQGGLRCPTLPTCTNSQQCPEGWVCAQTCGCAPQPAVCNPPCGTFPSGLAGPQAASSADSGRLNGR
jgi:hypothetical protein